MEQSQTGNQTYPRQKIEFDELMERVKVLLPLVKGWNPDIFLALSPAGLVLCGILDSFLPREVRTLSMSFEGDEMKIDWDNSGDLQGKRVLVVTDRFPDETNLTFLESFLKKKHVLSSVKLVMLGKGVEYSCFPELPEDSSLPWGIDET